METIKFEPLSLEHGKKVMEIFNHYIENSFAAYPEQKMPDEFFGKFLEMTKGYPAFSILVDQEVVGFCFVHAFNPFHAFKETVEISYFIDNRFSGRGLGKMALEKLETASKAMGIKTILASISSENANSLSFHRKNGFMEQGRLPAVGKKFGKSFDIVWMGKRIEA